MKLKVENCRQSAKSIGNIEIERQAENSMQKQRPHRRNEQPLLPKRQLSAIMAA
jgi:hypothetical protein